MSENLPLLREPARQVTYGLSEALPVAVMVESYGRRDSGPANSMHYELELGISLHGKVRRSYRDARMDLGPGDAWFCGIWEPHAWGVLDAPYKRLVLLIWPPLLANLHFPEAPTVDWMAPFILPVDERPKVEGTQRRKVLRRARRISSQADMNDAMLPVRLRLMALDLLLVLLEGQKPVAGGGAARAQMYSLVTPALERVFRSRSLITNKEAARACSLSRDRFARIFQQLMGVSFAKFAQRHRLSSAARQLRATDTPLKGVAREWGFADESHLTRLFVQHYGCTPGKYRDASGAASRMDLRPSPRGRPSGP